MQRFIAKRQAESANNAEINRETAALKRAFNLATQAEKIAKKPYMQQLEEKNVRQGFGTLRHCSPSSPMTFALP